MRKIPEGSDVTSALLKRIIKLANEERAKPFSKQEEIVFTNKLQQLARDQATLWHWYRHIPVRQIRKQRYGDDILDDPQLLIVTFGSAHDPYMRPPGHVPRSMAREF